MENLYTENIGNLFLIYIPFSTYYPIYIKNYTVFSKLLFRIVHFFFIFVETSVKSILLFDYHTFKEN